MPDDGTRTGIARREVLAAAIALSVSFVSKSATAEASLDRAAFQQASALVTGVRPEELTGLSDALWAGFQGQAAVLTQLASLASQPAADFGAAIRGTAMEPVARALAAAWYTGQLGAGPSAKLLSYDDALCWTAAGFGAAPGTCAGEFGFWSDPPQH